MNLIIVSLAAQTGTLPLVWCHFGVFPLYFLLTNIIVVPLAFVLMSLAVPVWALSWLPLLQQPLVVLLKLVVALMNGTVGVIASLPGASLSLPAVDVVGACFVAVLLFVFAFGLVVRKKWLLLLSSCCTVCMVLFLLLQPHESIKGDGLIIYNNNKNPLLHAITDGGINYLVSTVPQLDAEYEYSSSPFVKREKLALPQWVNGSYCDPQLTFNDGLLQFGGLKVRLVDNEHWRDNMYVMPADVVLLCRGFLGPMEELVEAYPSGCVVLDASLYKRSRERILRECSALGIEPVDISETGAVMLSASGDSFRMIPMKGR